ncbi:hypothetical protein I2I11_06520 [Pontibacter sp. 172403-2]|uniref:hypothetical protein n=1 Tax=Pontibacter rufus TaxID=2791028 RepID=UPI0018AF5B36|nr:hypothetical protein [Pontibacter sp. 172403-2]MBF9252938.1 hypothetical protein [Pontibacter sp. 172403-2]
MQNNVWFITEAGKEWDRKLSFLTKYVRALFPMVSSSLASYIPAQSTLLLFVLLFPAQLAFSQEADSTRFINHFAGAVSVTNKGISTIPSFTLGKPAVIFDMSVGTRKLSFEPQFRFALEGKPWSFLFWWRYKLLSTDKFQVNLGAHPALNFRTEQVLLNGTSKEVIVARRYLAGELAPTYLLTKDISLGLYYLYSRGIEKDVVRNTHFLSLRSSFANIRLSEQYFMRFTPQVYYLKADMQHGFYVNPTLVLAKRNFPFSVSSTFNKTIKTSIPASRNALWNVSLIYSFNKEYIQRQPVGL